LKIKKSKLLSILNRDALLDIHHTFSSEKINVVGRGLLPNWYRKSTYYSIILYFLIFFKKIFSFNNFKFLNKKTPIVLVAYTNNQRNAISSLKKRSDTKIFGNHKYGDFFFPEYKSYFLSIPYYNEISKIYNQSVNHLRLIMNYAFHEYWLTYGHFIMLSSFFKKIEAQIVVVSNDNYLRTRIIPYVCDYIGIKSIYIQHASVSFDYPSLIFNYSLLEGRDTLDKYLKIGNIKSEVFLLGSLKDSNANNLCSLKQVAEVGICFGLVDDIAKVNDLIVEVLKVFDSNKIFLRPHPRDNRNIIIKDLVSKYGIHFSDSKKVDSSSFLSKVQCIISSESNIHLEAILQNVSSLYYNLTEGNRQKFDVYGFISNKLISNFSDKELLIKMLLKLKKSKPNVRQKARYYNETIGTKYDGRSFFLYDQLISLIKNDDMNSINNIFKVEKIHGINIYSIR
jgi:hypothetical protein